jgi:hypothetical protein
MVKQVSNRASPCSLPVTASVCSAPHEAWTTLAPAKPPTFVGVQCLLSEEAPSPSWPLVLSPKLQTPPSAAGIQKCAQIDMTHTKYWTGRTPSQGIREDHMKLQASSAHCGSGGLCYQSSTNCMEQKQMVKVPFVSSCPFSLQKMHHRQK